MHAVINLILQRISQAIIETYSYQRSTTISEYDQEMLQSHTTDQDTAPWVRGNDH